MGCKGINKMHASRIWQITRKFSSNRPKFDFWSNYYCWVLLQLMQDFGAWTILLFYTLFTVKSPLKTVIIKKLTINGKDSQPNVTELDNGAKRSEVARPLKRCRVTPCTIRKKERYLDVQWKDINYCYVLLYYSR